MHDFFIPPSSVFIMNECERAINLEKWPPLLVVEARVINLQLDSNRSTYEDHFGKRSTLAD